MSRSYYQITEIVYKMNLELMKLHLKTETNQALATGSKHHQALVRQRP